MAEMAAEKGDAALDADGVVNPGAVIELGPNKAPRPRPRPVGEGKM